MTEIPLPPAVPAPPQPPRDRITPAMLESLSKTRPWVRFLSVVGYILSVIMIVVGFGMAVFGAISAVKSAATGAALVGMGILYGAMGLLYFFPSRYLSRYAHAIADAKVAPDRTRDLERALEHQKSFWKFAGIMTLVMFLLYIPGVLAAIAIPNLLTAIQRSKQKRTIADMRTIAVALEAYASDNNTYPRVNSLEEAAKQLEPKYVKTLPRLDGWGTPFVYATGPCDANCATYFIASAGKDGTFELASPAEYADKQPEETKNYDRDIVFANGEFVRYPEGIPKD